MDTKNERFFTKHPYIFVVAALIVFVLAAVVSTLIIGFAGFSNLITANNYFDSNLSFFISEVVAIILLLAVAWKLEFFDQTFFSKRNLKIGALLSVPILIIAVFWNILPPVLYNNPSLFRIDIGLIVIAFLTTLAIGFAEEILFRGLIFRNFLRRYGMTKKGIYISIIVSSVIFGLVHASNAVSSSPDAIIQQVIYATAIGIILALFYLITGNLLVPALCHGLFDFTDYVIPGFYNIPYDAALTSDWVQNLIVAIVFIVIAVIIVKKINVEDTDLVKQLE